MIFDLFEKKIEEDNRGKNMIERSIISGVRRSRRSRCHGANGGPHLGRAPRQEPQENLRAERARGRDRRAAEDQSDQRPEASCAAPAQQLKGRAVNRGKD